ncbi:MbtH family NRPS accessory protein [Streptomyces sp. JJ36]|uniref:MbtH family protein n=1 Tax=Streptomyces sp. JJ36 TaxID=2736645 RepID=UPI001F30835E|nr:MbtH family NRPS accessory protein [Streptomyces sp. JJ36]MCF6525325.1 MbtH family NRPS accessory protein [Streptomyces sp. JJ36]
MTAADRDPFPEYRVVVNDEEQYSIWPTARELPAGWRDTGDHGPRQHCLDRIEELWTDMRPRSLRVAMEDEGAGAGAA